MWSAFTSDLLDFVNTIKDDTSKTLSQVIGDPNDEDDEVNIREKQLTDIRRSFLTYSSAVDEIHMKEYERYMKKFSLSNFATDIANILDIESDVSRFYAELVPISIKPEEFWSRYFFRVMLLNRNGAVNLDDDEEEEELQWESADTDKQEALSGSSSSANSQSINTSSINEDQRQRDLVYENSKLLAQVTALVSRITDLEKSLQEKDATIAQLQLHASLNTSTDSKAHPSVTAAAKSPVAKASKPKQAKAVEISDQLLHKLKLNLSEGSFDTRSDCSSEGSTSSGCVYITTGDSDIPLVSHNPALAPAVSEVIVSTSSSLSPQKTASIRQHIIVDKPSPSKSKVEAMASPPRAGDTKVVSSLASLAGDDDEEEDLEDGWS